MRAAAILALTTLALTASGVAAQNAERRHGLAADDKSYPQATPKEALASIVKAIIDDKIDYLVAWLADPAFVDERVKDVYGGKFAEQVADTRGQLTPFAAKQLERFVKDGAWEEGQGEATASVAAVKDRRVKMVRKGKRWYLANGWGK